MPGLTPLGPIASTVTQLAATETEQEFEQYGLFVLGDANDVHHYSGMDLGTRWLCRLQGSICDTISDWPTPNQETWRYQPSQEAAQNMYQQLRGHIERKLPGQVQFRDARQEIGMNVPSAMGESIWHQGQQVGRIFFDQMTDMQIAISNTKRIRRHAAHPAQPDGPALIDYYTMSYVQTLAVAKNARGVPEHIVIMFTPNGDSAGMLAQGMPRATRPEGHEMKPLSLTSGFLVAFWGRASGPSVMKPTNGAPPAPMLHQYLGNEIARALHTNVPGLDARLPAPAAYAIRVEPGLYDVAYYDMDLDDEESGGYSFVALSKQGAPPFQPVGAMNNGGGRRIGGMTMEEYAMMAVERERAMMQFGMTAGNVLAQICQKYQQPIPQNAMGVDIGYAARIVEWDTLIQRDPKLTAQFLSSKQIATLRLQGIEPSAEQIAQIAQQQSSVAQSLAQNQNNHQNAVDQIKNGGIALVEFARTHTVEQIMAEARNVFSIETQKAGTPAHGLERLVHTMKQPGYQGNPKFNNVEQVTEKIATACYRCMKPEDQKSEGSEKSYVKDVIADVYEKNGVPVPGVGGFLGRFMDKL